IGKADTAAAPAVALMKGVLKAMFLTKLKFAVAFLLVGALGAGGVAYRGAAATAPAQAPAKPRSELDELRRQNELLKLTLEVVPEKVRAKEGEIRPLKGQVSAATNWTRGLLSNSASWGSSTILASNFAGPLSNSGTALLLPSAGPRNTLAKPADPLKEAEAALKALRETRDPAARKRAAEALEQATRRLREQHK